MKPHDSLDVIRKYMTPNTILWAFAISLGVSLGSLGFYFQTFNGEFSTNSADWAAFGSLLSGIAGFSSVVIASFALLVLWSSHEMQKLELKEIKNQFSKQLDEIKFNNLTNYINSKIIQLHKNLDDYEVKIKDASTKETRTMKTRNALYNIYNNFIKDKDKNEIRLEIYRLDVIFDTLYTISSLIKHINLQVECENQQEACLDIISSSIPLPLAYICKAAAECDEAFKELDRVSFTKCQHFEKKAPPTPPPHQGSGTGVQ